MTPLSGSRTRAFLDGFYFGVEKWEFSPSATMTEWTNTESPIDANGNTNAQFVATMVTSKLTMSLFYDDDNLPFLSPAPLQAGVTFTANRLYTKSRMVAGVRTTASNVDSHFYIGTLIVEGSPTSSQVKDKLLINVTFQVSGLIGYPNNAGNTLGL